jgi:hypothetical protein
MSDMSFSGDLLDLGIAPLTPEQLGEIDPEALAAAGTPKSVQAVQPVYKPTTTTTTTTDNEDDNGATLPVLDTTAEIKRNAFSRLKELLSRVGLSSLTQKTQDLIARGILDGDAIMFELRDTEEYQKRFIGNVVRRTKGLPELSPLVYVDLERQFRETFKANGLNPDLYNDETDFRQLIEGDVSPGELQTRIEKGYRAVIDADPEVMRQMTELYNVSTAQMAQYFLDPEKTTPQLERQAQAALVAARAKEQGNTQLSKLTAEELVSRGYSESQSMAAFSLLSDQAGLYKEMAGETALTEAEKIGSVFGYSPEGKQKIKQRVGSRKSPFQGGGSFAKTTGQTSGTIETGLGVAE